MLRGKSGKMRRTRLRKGAQGQSILGLLGEMLKKGQREPALGDKREKVKRRRLRKGRGTKFGLGKDTDKNRR